MIYFDSDYMEGAHPEVMQALQKTNLEHTVGYGNDPYSEQAREAIRNALSYAGYRVAIDSPTNQQFFVLPNDVVDALRAEGVSFEDWGPRGEVETTVRFVTSWATTDADVDALTEIFS